VGPVDQVGIALGEAGHAGADLFDPAGGLVAEDERRLRVAAGFRRVVLEHGDVGVAAAGAGDLEEDLAGSGGGLVHVLEDGECLEFFEDDGLHRMSFHRRMFI
jgi:hypothetical protein